MDVNYLLGGTKLKRDTSKIGFNGTLVPWTNLGFGDNGVGTKL